jgi:agmatinase
LIVIATSWQNGIELIKLQIGRFDKSGVPRQDGVMGAKSTRIPPFMGTVRAKTPRHACLAVFGARHGTPYPGIDNRVHQTAADAFRLAVQADGQWLDHHDYDFGGQLIPEDSRKAVDLGNLPTRSKDGRGNRKKIRSATESILAAGAVPILFGGDDSVPVPFIEGFAKSPPITILQIDAHIDWREERYKVREGFSSTMRRASEQPHVWRIVQAGARGLGSARQQELNDAAKWGARIIPCHRLHHEGVNIVLEHIEPNSDVVICLDLDVLDSSVMPAVAAPSPGGLSFVQLTDMIAAVAGKARIAGFNMVEFVPARDLTGTAAYTAARVALHVMAHVLRQSRRA